jgi:prepilin-type N-terminal cleavage/methylation domain-containing protein
MKIYSLTKSFGRHRSRRQSGMTLAEVVISMAIAGLAVGGIVGGYIYCATSAEKSGLYLAASARAMERLEETRSATWNKTVDQVVSANFTNKDVILDLSGSGGNMILATLNTSIAQISTAPPLKRIRVDCIWLFKGSERITNTIETCRARDQ